ncbi:MAG: hypothetical protein HYV28_16120 [Ignavibacteriales bacterium]|nr:hypothetical protein [Ignavibacteriales bacterium]
MPSVYATITEIEQVLLNIIRNAAQAFIHDDSTKPKPVLTLRTYSENTFVCLDIIDNGPGIHEKVLGRIFEPFFTTKDIGEGTGLGLSVAYMIVHKNHSGVLTAESKVGKGSRFTIKLPGSRQETGTNQFSNEQLNLSL